jgi:hypothetical protein
MSKHPLVRARPFAGLFSGICMRPGGVTMVHVACPDIKLHYPVGYDAPHGYICVLTIQDTNTEVRCSRITQGRRLTTCHARYIAVGACNEKHMIPTNGPFHMASSLIAIIRSTCQSRFSSLMFGSSMQVSIMREANRTDGAGNSRILHYHTPKSPPPQCHRELSPSIRKEGASASKKENRINQQN